MLSIYKNILTRGIGLAIFSLFISVAAFAQNPNSENKVRINIQPSDTTVAVGASFTFQAELQNDTSDTVNTFTWSVSDSSIASIDQNGLFTALTEGEIEVIATLDSLTAEVEVEVENEEDEPEEFEEDRLRILPSDTTLATGDSLYLRAQFNDGVVWTDTSVTWQLSDSTLATLNGDTLYAVQEGELKLIAVLDSLTAEAEIEIEEEEKEEEEENESEYSISILPADTLVQVDSEVAYKVFNTELSEYITDSLSWSLSSDLGTIDSNGVAQFTSRGFGFVEVRYGDSKARTSVRVQDLTADSSGANSIVVNIPKNNPKAPPAVQNLTEGEVLRLKGFASPLNYLNGGTIYFPHGSLTEDIRIDVLREDVTDTTNHPGNKNHKIVGGISFDVFISDSLISPYYFEEPVEISIPYKRGLLRNLGIDVQNLSMFSLENDGTLDSTAVSSVVIDTVSGRIFGQVSHFSTYVLASANGDGVATHVEERESREPNQIALSQNYPNPFNPTTTIALELPSSAAVDLSVYDVLGRKVATITNDRLNAGTHTLRFDGSSLSSGLYIYRLSVDGAIVETKMMTLLK
ncbi:Ig-like domain-containing protein [Gracilimonas mengyeensis]|uniref:Por secretion system C-terminal sorting domain-containing protein n=1 Tax=Gracilimonas mengyeensis TaxID=1302730 RepID=A0A521DHT0_9BACT|nr:Ig-like domain-containing protein [Gracilimonas mengyeensis]SMO71188.1 Por secretion system C-terminal sorting domain-containing protein [Gracilimonas mengyeensis]